MKNLLKINVELDIHINDKVRILTKKNQFQKGTESRYSDEVFTVKKINGNSITLNNDEVYKRTSLLIVPKSTISDQKNVIIKINQQNKQDSFLKIKGVDTTNILETKRGKNKLLEALKPEEVIIKPGKKELVENRGKKELEEIKNKTELKRGKKEKEATLK
jgi:hypothetical protein